MELASLLALPGLNLRLLAGGPGAPRPITWVHTTELVDPGPWLEGGELLLTTGVQIRGADDAEEFVERVTDAEISAVGFGIQPVYDAVPAALVEAAARRGLPLVEIPSTTPFIALSRAVGEWWAEQQTALFRRVIAGQRNIAQGALAPDARTEVVRRLADELGCWAVLAGDGAWVVAGSPAERVQRWAHDQASAPRSASTQLDDQSVLLHKVSGGGRPAQLMVGRDAAFNSAERSLVLIAEALLSAAATSGTRASSDVLANVAVQLLLEGHVEACWRVAGALFEDGLPSLWTAVVEAVGPHDDAATPYRSSSRCLVATVGPERVWLVPADQTESLLDEVERRGRAAGYSGKVPRAGAPRAVEEARRALAFASSRGGPDVAGPSDVEGRGPLALVTADQVRAAQHVLAPLLADRRGETLRESLLVWFEEGTRWDRAASRLGVHRHTLRQRLDAAFERLGRDMEDPRDRLELWTSLSLLDR